MARKTVTEADKRPFAKTLLSLSNRRPLWEIWQDFITIAAVNITLIYEFRKDRVELLQKTLEKYNEKERHILMEATAQMGAAIVENPEQDFLGSIYMELELGNHWIGQFFTPYSVCQMMSAMATEEMVEKIQRKGYVTMNDPACGAGATLIAGIHAIKDALKKAGSPLPWQNHVQVTGQDVDFLTGLMCFIQLSLQGAAGYVKIGNTLTDPMTSKDNLENYWFTPMYFSKVWEQRRRCHNMDKFLSLAAKSPSDDS